MFAADGESSPVAGMQWNENGKEREFQDNVLAGVDIGIWKLEGGDWVEEEEVDETFVHHFSDVVV